MLLRHIGLKIILVLRISKPSFKALRSVPIHFKLNHYWYVTHKWSKYFFCDFYYFRCRRRWVLYILGILMGYLWEIWIHKYMYALYFLLFLFLVNYKNVIFILIILNRPKKNRLQIVHLKKTNFKQSTKKNRLQTVN